jgi:hypothetical protein
MEQLHRLPKCPPSLLPPGAPRLPGELRARMTPPPPAASRPRRLLPRPSPPAISCSRRRPPGHPRRRRGALDFDSPQCRLPGPPHPAVSHPRRCRPDRPQHRRALDFQLEKNMVLIFLVSYIQELRQSFGLSAIQFESLLLESVS